MFLIKQNQVFIVIIIYLVKQQSEDNKKQELIGKVYFLFYK